MKKGFTLIELLAVIVILAIIALIAVPIVLNIIDDAKESSVLRSAEFYLDAVEYAVADAFLYHGGLSDGAYPITPEGNICKTELSCTNENTLKVEVNGEKPTGGTIVLSEGKVTAGTSLMFDGFTATLNTDGTIVLDSVSNEEPSVEIGKLNSVCKPAAAQQFQQTAMEPGYEYNCKVDPNEDPYTFYVLNKSGNQINLIMDSNINSNGSVATDRIAKTENASKYNVLSFDPHSYYEELTGKSCEENGFDCDLGVIYSLGPINFMRFLSVATSNWTNLNPMEISTFEKENSDNKTFSTSTLGETYTTYARLPRATEMNAYNSSTGAYAYLYDNLLVSTTTIADGLTWENVETLVHSESSIGTADMAGVHVSGMEHTNNAGYYLETIGYDDGPPGFCAFFTGNIINDNFTLGIRPVITLDIQ